MAELDDPSQKERVDKFYRSVMRVAREVLEEGQKMGFGQTGILVKFRDGLPTINVLFNTKSSNFDDTENAKIAIAKILEDGDKLPMQRNQTFTIVRDNSGHIKRILVDNSITDVIQ